MNYVLAFLASLPATAAARQDDPYKGLQPGDRVMVTFRSGGTLSGVLILLPPPGGAVTRPGGPAPFTVLYFRSDSPECRSQDEVLHEWKVKHPEARVEEIPQGSRPDLWQAHSVTATPSLVFKDPTTGGQIRATGLQGADRLQEFLLQVRGGEGSRVDYTKETHITLDVSLEYPGLNGTMTLPKRDIREIRKLQKLDKETEERLMEEKAKVRQQLAAQDEARRKFERERDEKSREAIEASEREEKARAALSNELQAAVQKADRIQKGREFLKQFPPPEWGAEKLKQIANKNLTRLPVTAEERRFTEIYDLWLEARKYEEEQQKKEGEKPPPEK